MTSESGAALRDPVRLAALRQLALLDTPSEAAFDRLTRLATATLGVPVALVSLVDGDRQFFASCVGLPEPWRSARQTPLSHSFCQHTVASRAPLIIADARDHPLVRDNRAIPALDVVAYAGIPLVTADGHALGSFCAIDHRPRDWTAAELAILTDLAAAAVTEIELRAARADLERRVAERTAELRVANRTLAGELAKRARAEAALRESEGRYRALVEQAPDGICVFEEGGRFLEVSARACAMLGYARAELLQLRTTDLIAPADLAARPLPPLVAGGGSLLEERLMRRKDGTTFPAEASVTRLPDGRKQAILRDIGERKRLEARLAHQATHDALTGLPNRRLFEEHLGRALAPRHRDAGLVAVAFLDLDHFKVVNDSLGHAVGDRLLTVVADRLRGSVRPGDLVARFGGDEFMVLLRHLADEREVVEVAERIRSALRAPIALVGRAFVVGASVGIVLRIPDGTPADDLLRDVDVAMYQAKAAGKGRYAVFDPRMRAAALGRLELEADLQRGLEY